MSDEQNSVSDLLEDNQYKYGFTTDVESETFAKGLNEEVVRAISKKKNEPEFMLNFRLKAFEKWKTMKEPAWPNVHYPPIDFQDISYYSAPKKKKQLASLDEVDPEVMRTFEKLGIPLDEQKKLAKYCKKLDKAGIKFIVSNELNSILSSLELNSILPELITTCSLSNSLVAVGALKYEL